MTTRRTCDPDHGPAEAGYDRDHVSLATDGAPVVSPDWAAIGADRKTIVAEYQQVFGG